MNCDIWIFCGCICDQFEFMKKIKYKKKSSDSVMLGFNVNMFNKNIRYIKIEKCYEAVINKKLKF